MPTYTYTHNPGCDGTVTSDVRRTCDGAAVAYVEYWTNNARYGFFACETHLHEWDAEELERGTPYNVYPFPWPGKTIVTPAGYRFDLGAIPCR